MIARVICLLPLFVLRGRAQSEAVPSHFPIPWQPPGITMHKLHLFVAAALCIVPTAAHAEPTTDQNNGTWVDAYNDSSGIAPPLLSIGGNPGQVGIVRDPIARNVTLPTNGTAGSWFTSEIVPASFAGWGSVYLDYSASAPGQVQVEVWDVTNPATPVLRIGPVAPGASNDPAFGGRVVLAPAVPASAARIRIRVILSKASNNPIAPTVTTLKATFTAQSVLQASFEAPVTRPAGDVIQIRMPVSVSFVNATGYVAYATVTAVDNDRYSQNPLIGFSSATDGGVYHAGPGPLVVQGVSVPARSVYWSVPSQQAGKTYAYYASFTTPNGVVRELEVDFQGAVKASNAPAVLTATRTTWIDAAPRTGLDKNAGGTFVIGGVHYAREDAAITLSVSPHNWWNQGIPSGAQVYFQPVVWDSFQDFIDKGAITSAAAISERSSNGLLSGPNGITVRGITVPKNSVYWVLADDLQLGQRLNLTYKIQLSAQSVPVDTVVNNCTTPEAWLATPQQAIPPAQLNDCSGAACARRSACLPIHIRLDDSPGFAFAKGDSINGSTGIRDDFDDNPAAFTTWGQPIDFKLSVGNSGLSSLDNVVVYDLVPASSTFVAASIPADANNANKVWYYTGTSTASAPDLYTTAPTVNTTIWSASAPAIVTWIAYEIPRLRSSYCAPTNPPTPNALTNCTGLEQSSVIMDYTVVTAANDPSSCSTTTLRNVASARVYRYTPIVGPTIVVPNGFLPRTDWEEVDVRPLAPDLGTSFASGTGSAEPGETATHTIVVQNRSAVNNPLDTARQVVATIHIPSVVANGLDTTLAVTAINANGGGVTYGGNTITVRWPAIIPNAQRSVTLTYQLPTGIRNATTFKTTADLVAADDCGIPRAQVSAQTSIASSPALIVHKDLDYRVVDPGTTVEYTLTYRNNGTAPSTKTWILDRIADQTTLVSASLPAGGQVWFSDDLPPYSVTNPTSAGLPAALVADFQFSDAVVRAHFAPGGSPVSGFVAAPAGSKWVAFLVDTNSVIDPSTGDENVVSPAIFPTGVAEYVRLRVQVPNSENLIGQLAVNEAAIVSDELLQAIGNRVEFIVSDEPGLALAKSCNAVVSEGEVVTYDITFRNDTTNLDEMIVITDTLPEDFVLDQTFGIVSDPPTSDELIECCIDDACTPLGVTCAGHVRLTLTFEGFAPLAEGMVRFRGEYEDVQSGDFVTNETLATAANEVGEERVFYDACTTLIENADLSVAKFVDNAQPRSGEVVTFTLDVANVNQRSAAAVVVTDDLSESGSFVGDLSYIGGSLQVLTPGWSVATGMPSGGATSFALTLVRNNLAAGVVPGRSGPIRIAYRALVNNNLGPGKTRVNKVTVTTSTGQDDNVPHSATASITTPLPDPYVGITTQTLVKPGEIASWTIRYGNNNPEDAANTVVYFDLPDGPTPDGTADFTFATVVVPQGVTTYYSTASLMDTSPLSVRPPGTGWTLFTPGTPPTGTVNRLAFVVTHCDPAVTPCDVGDIHRNLGPFDIVVKATARKPVTQALPAIGQPFVGCTSIKMIGNVFADDDDTNNGPVCATVKTPGIGLRVGARCSPNGRFPGVTPGGATTFSFDFENTGTVPAYGVSFVIALDSDLEYLLDSAGQVSLTDATGEVVNPVGADGVRIATPIAWSRSGGTITLGPAGNTTYALAPGDKGTITVNARVDAEVGDSNEFTSSVTGSVAGRVGDIQEDELQRADNTATCGAWVYRADVFVIKSIENASDPDKSFADGGDRLAIQVEYGNAGHFEASGVIMADSLVKGLGFVSRSVRNVPVGAVVEYDDGSGGWSYVPTGTVDTTVRAVRVRYPDGVTMPAPATGVFRQTTVPDFDRGIYKGTRADAATESVMAGGVDDGCRDVQFCAVESGGDTSCQSGSYRPEGSCCQRCCPSAEDNLKCLDQRREEYALAYPAWLACVRAGNSNCVEPETPVAQCAVSAECAAVASCYGSKRSQPRECTGYGRGYYAPPGQCNQACCPPDSQNRDAFKAWQADCGYRYEDAIEEYTACTEGESSVAGPCGEMPRNECNEGPLACRVGGDGLYASPAFPGANEGNVIDWGSLIVNATFDDALDQNMTVSVNDENGTTLASFELADGTGTYTYDLSGINPALHDSLSLTAEMTGCAADGMTDIVPTITDFWGYPTGLSETNRVIGVQDMNQSYRNGHKDQLTAWVWREGDINVTSLHAGLPINSNATVAAAWRESYASDINDSGVVVGWAEPRPNAINKVADACKVPGHVGALYSPPESERAVGIGGNDFLPLYSVLETAPGVFATSVATRHMQWLIMPADLGSQATNIAALNLRTRYVKGSSGMIGVTVRLGYAATTSLGDNLESNASGPQQLVFQGNLSWTADPSTDPMAFVVPIRFGDFPFAYDPTRKQALLVDFQWDGGATVSGGVGPYTALLDANDCTDIAPYKTRWVPESQPTGRVVGSVGYACTVSTEVVLSEPLLVLPSDVLVAWTPGVASNDPRIPLPYTAQCLPRPDDEVACVPTDRPELPLEAFPHINASGVIAATFDADKRIEQAFLASATPVGSASCTAKVECQDETGEPLDLLYNGESRDSTAVLAFSCAGQQGSTTHLYQSDVFIICDETTNSTNSSSTGTTLVARLNPSVGPGVVPSPAADEGLFAYAVYEGAERVGNRHQASWSMAMGFDDSFFYGCPAGAVHQNGKCITCTGGREAINGRCGYCPQGSKYVNGRCLSCPNTGGTQRQLISELGICGGAGTSDIPGVGWTEPVVLEPTGDVEANVTSLDPENTRPCWAYSWATAASELWPQLSTPTTQSTPVVRFKVPLNPVGPNGQPVNRLACGRHDLNSGSGVVAIRNSQTPVCFENLLTTDEENDPSVAVQSSHYAQYAGLFSVIPMPDSPPSCETNWLGDYAKYAAPVDHAAAPEVLTVRVFNDANRDRTRQSGEGWVDGYEFTLSTQNYGNRLLEGGNTIYSYAKTGGGGPAVFASVAAGNYMLTLAKKQNHSTYRGFDDDPDPLNFNTLLESPCGELTTEITSATVANSGVVGTPDPAAIDSNLRPLNAVWSTAIAVGSPAPRSKDFEIGVACRFPPMPVGTASVIPTPPPVALVRPQMVSAHEARQPARFGTPTVWCPTAEGYVATPIRVGDLTDRIGSDFIGNIGIIPPQDSPAPPTIITGIDDAGIVIGVSSSCDDSVTDFAAHAWIPAVGGDDNCTRLWRQIDLDSNLPGSSDPTAYAVVPMGIDDGVITGHRLFGSGRRETIIWHADVGGYGYIGEVVAGADEFDVTTLPNAVELAQFPKGGAGGSQYGPSGLGETYVLDALVYQSTANAIDDGAIAYTSYGDIDGNVTYGAWFNDGDSNVSLQRFGDSVEIVTGMNRDAVLGVSYYRNYFGGGLGEPWIWKDGEHKMLGLLLNSSDVHVPTQVNHSGLVIGSAANSGGNSITRVFQWRDCTAGTPRLDDWAVNYQTDRNPSWGFDVELADICTQSISNEADITTSTPEITLSNNKSRTSMSVNTADLSVALNLDQAVVGIGGEDYISGTLDIDNAGPGDARDVDVLGQLPEGCGDAVYDVEFDNGDFDYALAFDDATGQALISFPTFPANGIVSIYFECASTAQVAGQVLAASASISSPTIDCDAGDDDTVEKVVVGFFPNLWVTIDGPTSTPIGSPTPYLLTFGNNGNEDAGGAVVVTLPPGTTCELTDNNQVLRSFASFANGFVEAVCDGNTLTVTPLGINAGDSYEVPFTLTWTSCDAADVTATVSAEISSVAIVDPQISLRQESDIADNVADATTLVSAPLAELSLYVERSEDALEVGQEVTYTVHYRNSGSSTAYGAALVFEAPPWLELTSLEPSMGGNPVIMPIGRDLSDGGYLLPDDIGSVIIKGIVTGPGSAVPITLRVESGACEVSAQLVPPAVIPADSGVHVLVSSSLGSACASEVDRSLVTWTVTVTNPRSSGGRTDVPVFVTVPAGLAYVAGSIRGANGNDARAPELAWTVDIPSQGAAQVTFKTRVVATSGVIAVAARASIYTGSGALALDCGERIVVDKQWQLGCGPSGQTLEVTVRVENRTSRVVDGFLFDHIGDGLTVVTAPVDAFPEGDLLVSPTRLNPGAFKELSFTLGNAADVDVIGGNPVSNRAAFLSMNAVGVSSNQVAASFDAAFDDLGDIGATCDGSDADFCPRGTVSCGDGALPVCAGDVNRVEICNGSDDDCDGATDEGYTLGVLAVGAACDSADADNCPTGLVTCSGDGSTVSCVGDIAKVELCNGLDDTCNGAIDEDYVSLGDACDGGDADLCARGTIVCAEGGVGTTCSETGANSVEKCNGVDDDCDGATDEGFANLGAACDGGDDDACAGGTIACSPDGLTTECRDSAPPKVEKCNASDDDCDTLIDEGLGIGNACEVGLGVCRAAGVLVCNLETGGTRCGATAGAAGVEICDGLDNDCDGVVDDGPTAGSSICPALETEITTGPPAVTASTTAVFTYINPLSPPHTVFQCSLDGGAWTSCNNGTTTYTALAPGAHTLLVRAVGGNGAVDPTPAIHAWVIDTTVPDTIILSGPTSPSPSSSGTFVFGASVTDVDHYMCVLDPNGPCPATGNAAYVECPTVYSYTDLADGSHTICVYVVDSKGTPDPLPASQTWIIDTTPPETAITDQPAKVTSATTAVFDYIDPDAPTTDTFECRIDGGEWTECDGKTTTYTNLADGEHTFEVRTVDPNGNRDPTPASYTWSICAANAGLKLTCSDSLTVDAEADVCGWAGQVQALLLDGCDNELEVFVDGSYLIGTSPVLFTASDDAANTAECTTQLTVRDVTPPTVTCGVVIGTVPAIMQATASDACGAVVTLSDVVCTKVEGGVETPVALADCPITVTDDTIEITGRLPSGELKLRYTATATDPSGNVNDIDCSESYAPDRDGDGVLDSADNCIDVPNTDQVNGDGDGFGDACDVCPAEAGADQTDSDSDGIGDACDNCVGVANAEQVDSDDDGFGDMCDVCPEASDVDQVDSNDDGVGDACSDKDKDGVLDSVDNCVDVANGDQLDSDGDTVGDACDEAPFEGLTAEGSGGCASGTTGALAALLGLLGLLTLRLRPRPSRPGSGLPDSDLNP